MSFFGNFLVKQMFKSKMKGIPESEQNRIIEMIEKNPALFEKIGTEVQAKMKGGMDQNTAAMKVFKNYQKELEQITK